MSREQTPSSRAAGTGLERWLIGLAALAASPIVPPYLGALAALSICALAGLFQTVSHATLVFDAGGPQQPVSSVALHATPGPLLLALSLCLLIRPQPGDEAA
ncbi:MAG TPA: hypothetical protein VGR11_12670 [Solirubrobacteraceae bacterium]|nr:hypothetical protein [Solirubrobacteraceae bacterium]